MMHKDTCLGGLESIYIPRALTISELRSCLKVEVAILGPPVPNKPNDFCGR